MCNLTKEAVANLDPGMRVSVYDPILCTLRDALVTGRDEEGDLWVLLVDHVDPACSFMACVSGDEISLGWEEEGDNE